MAISIILTLGGLVLAVLALGAGLTMPNGGGKGALGALLVGLGAAGLGVVIMLVRAALWVAG